MDDKTLERFMNKVLILENECWEWISQKDGRGYGRFSYNGRPVISHRLSYEHFVGPFDLKLQIDHLCHFTSCVNPDHLEPVTNFENTRRAAIYRHEQLDHKYDPHHFGLRVRCLVCYTEERRRGQSKRNARTTEWRSKNKQHIAEYQRQYRKRKKEKI